MKGRTVLGEDVEPTEGADERFSAYVGTTVDVRYEVRRLIARGGMGLVFEARHRYSRRTVVVKVLAPEARGIAEAHGRLLREAVALTAVRHPGFVEVLDAGICSAHGPYVVMELLEGRSLDGILAARRFLPVADVVSIGLQVCEAIEHAHSRGVIHRDLKPSNFFVTRSDDGQELVKVIDLGVAAVAAERLEHHDAKLTSTREVLGTPEYMAPEQLWGRAVDARTDVYALGMSLFECLTGDVAYVGTYPEIVTQVAAGTSPPRVRARRPDAPSALAGVIETALEKEPSARYPSVAAFAQAILAARGVSPTQAHLAPVDAVALAAGHAAGAEPAVELVRRKGAPGNAASGVENRRFLRAPYVTMVLLLLPDGAEIYARCEEISEGGMLVVSPTALEKGATLGLRFATPVAGDIVRVQATVRWTANGRGRCAAGVQFASPPPSLRSVIAEYAQLFADTHSPDREPEPAPRKTNTEFAVPVHLGKGS